ncbi:hypothetical protein EDC04DRAFT_2598799 [Pisolithus marmoratus]|nr:hypothetical protein EDC04DRAFT_2598799 [Pisolithus marmoratus]
MVVMLGNWNTTKISICKGNETGLDINVGPALAESSCSPCVSIPCLANVGKSVHGPVLLGKSEYFCKSALIDIKDTGKQQMCINQFISLLAGNYQVALTEVRNSSFHTPGLGGPTSLIIFPNTTLGSAIKESTTIAWSHWDGITEQPALNGENPILALMPTSYSGETLGMAVEHAARAPEVKAHNVTIMHKIVDLISMPTLGLWQCEGGDMKLDAELKVPLQSFLTSSHCQCQEDIAHLRLRSIGRVTLWRSLTLMVPNHCGLHQPLHILNKKRAEQQCNLEKVALHARKFIKKPSQLLSKVDQDDDDDTPSAGPSNYKHAELNDGFHSDPQCPKQVKPTSVQLTDELLGTLHRMEDEGDDTTT